MELKEILTQLLGAEHEANRVIEESQKEASGILQSVRDDFAGEREDRLRSAHEQAKATVETARNAGAAEASQILAMGEDERKKMNLRFNEKANQVVEDLVNEIAQEYSRQGAV